MIWPPSLTSPIPVKTRNPTRIPLFHHLYSVRLLLSPAYGASFLPFSYWEQREVLSSGAGLGELPYLTEGSASFTLSAWDSGWEVLRASFRTESLNPLKPRICMYSLLSFSKPG